MEIIIPNFFFSYNLSSPLLVLIAVLVTAVCCVFATLFTIRSKSDGGGVALFKKACNCVCSCGESNQNCEKTALLNGGSRVVGELNEDRATRRCGGENMVAKMAAVSADRQTGASMMEMLVPEITTHALSFLDYPSLCRLSMTNSLMRKAANDDNAWKALYHKVPFFFSDDFLTLISSVNRGLLLFVCCNVVG